MHVDYELAEVLADQFNSYASMTEDLELLEADWVLERLLRVFHPEDLELLIDDDFGRGLVMGQLATLHTWEEMSGDDGEA